MFLNGTLDPPFVFFFLCLSMERGVCFLSSHVWSYTRSDKTNWMVMTGNWRVVSYLHVFLCVSLPLESLNTRIHANFFFQKLAWATISEEVTSESWKRQYKQLKPLHKHKHALIVLCTNLQSKESNPLYNKRNYEPNEATKRVARTCLRQRNTS